MTGVETTFEKVMEAPNVAIAVMVLKRLSKKFARRSPGWTLVGGAVGAVVAILVRLCVYGMILMYWVGGVFRSNGEKWKGMGIKTYRTSIEI